MVVNVQRMESFIATALDASGQATLTLLQTPIATARIWILSNDPAGVSGLVGHVISRSGQNIVVQIRGYANATVVASSSTTANAQKPMAANGVCGAALCAGNHPNGANPGNLLTFDAASIASALVLKDAAFVSVNANILVIYDVEA